MEIVSTSLHGVFELNCSYFKDQRGTFLNAFRIQDSLFREIWGSRNICQVNISMTRDVGTLRGLHMQAYPHTEAKLVRCTSGRVWDVVADLRPRSPTFHQWCAVELSSLTANALFIPEGCAHGYQVLESSSELLYIHSGEWVPMSETGVRYDDPSKHHLAYSAYWSEYT